MAYNFPDSPSNGDTFTLNGVTYVYNSTKGVWKDTAVGVLPATVTSSDTAPSSPSAGDLWYRTDVSSLYVYYSDGSSSQWVGVSGPTGATGATGAAGADGADGADGSSVISYANFAAFPTTNNTEGDFGFAQDTKALYMWDGTEWDRVALGNDESPVITTEPPATNVSLNEDGTTSTVTMVAEDPEGFDITYGIAYKTANNARPSQLSADTTINQSTGVYTFTPTTTQANAGTFRARLSASDGARITTRLVDFKLAFLPQAANLLGRYEFSNTDSYDPAVSTTALNDLSGNANHQTIVNPGSLSADKHLTFTVNSTYINFTAVSSTSMVSQKSWAVIFRPSTGFDQHVMFDNASSDNTYYSTFHSSNGNAYYGSQSAWAGETVIDRVNGTNPGNNRTTAYNALTINQTNSVQASGLQMLSGQMQYNRYPSYHATHEVYAFVFWDTPLTLTEMEEVHNYYRDKLGTANMAAW